MSQSYRIVVLNQPWYYVWVAANNFADLGHEVLHLGLKDSTPEVFEKCLKDIEEFQPHFCFTFGLHLFDSTFPFAEQLEEFVVKRQIPVVSWYPDSPEVTGTPELLERWDNGNLPKNFYYLCLDYDHVDFIRRRGRLAERIFMPIDEQLATFSPDEETKKRFSADLSFSGSAITIPPQLESRIKGLAVVEIHEKVFLFQIYEALRKCLPSRNPGEIESFFSFVHTATKAFFKTWVNGPAEYVQKKILFLETLRKKLTADAYKVVYYHFPRLSDAYSYAHMSFYLDRLQNKGIKLWGGEWSKIINSPPNGSWLYRSDFHSVCAFSKMNFSFTKYQLMDWCGDRPLLTYMLGGFPITDHREVLMEMFKKDEIVTYKSVEEAESLIDYYGAHESERKAISARGRDRVLNQFTYTQLTRRIVDLVENQWKIV